MGRISGYTTKIRTGEYALHGGMKPIEILRVISSGKSVTYPITFPEGYNMFEMAELAEKKGIATAKQFLAYCHDSQFIKTILGDNVETLEGYLFPETYQVTRSEGARGLIKLMVRRFLQVYGEVAHLAPTNGFTRHQWVILASIIEKETGYEKERGLISSVFHNRLKKNMRLQTDPTVIYGKMMQTGAPVKNITKKDLRTKNSYNTYTFRGLPKGPISNPGRAALLSAFQPDDTEFLYFVSRNDGTSKFSETLKEHNSAVRKYQLNRNNRVGKSWRDLDQD